MYDEWQIAVADDWQLQRLAHSSLTDTAAPCPGDIGGPSEQLIQDPFNSVINSQKILTALVQITINDPTL